MKFVSYVRCGKPGFGAAVEGGLVDLTGRVAPEIVSLKGLLAAGREADAAAIVKGRRAEFGLSDVTLLPVLPDPDKVLCIGLNYETHRAETKRPEAKHPTVFMRFADSQMAHGAPMIRPRVTEKLDYEGELAIVIGKGGRYISKANALDHIAGYAAYNDGSVRDWQNHTHQFGPGKNFPATGGFGPYLVTPDEVGDYRKLPIETRLNGEVMQKATLNDLIFSLEDIIEYCSAFTPLVAGDVIVTGTPGGVGARREPPLFMKPGDVVEVDLGPIVGTLVNPIVQEV